ncbi:MAG TPA: hypothetical protein VMI34_23600 [Candidatus Bathyarchaeia archaeon]|nr:hypothetical protein [Candidatus Bathyarchaeia archaeon]
MSLTDVMSGLALQVFPEVGFVLFGTAFLVVAVSLLLGRNRPHFERGRRLPLEDEIGRQPGRGDRE